MFLQCEISWVSRSPFFSLHLIWFWFTKSSFKKRKKKKNTMYVISPQKKISIPVQLKKLTSVGLVVQVQQPCTTVAIQLQYIHSALTNWLDSASWFLFTLFGSYCWVGERTHQEAPGWNTGSAHWDVPKAFHKGNEVRPFLCLFLDKKKNLEYIRIDIFYYCGWLQARLRFFFFCS